MDVYSSLLSVLVLINFITTTAIGEMYIFDVTRREDMSDCFSFMNAVFFIDKKLLQTTVAVKVGTVLVILNFIGKVFLVC